MVLLPLEPLIGLVKRLAINKYNLIDYMEDEPKVEEAVEEVPAEEAEEDK